MTITKVTDAGLDRGRIVTPIIINGDMSIAQRGTSSTSQTSSGIKTVDRMRIATGGGMTFTIAQASESPTGQGFTKSYKVTSTTGDSSMSAAEYNIPLQMRMEGNTLQSIKKGTSSAEKITFAFWVYATVTGTYVLELSDDDNTRYVSQTYTVSSSNTWEKKIVNFPADTTGAFDNDNAKSLTINFWGGAGTNFTSGSLQTTWGAEDNTTRASGQVNAFASNNDVWQITGLQLEIGEFDANTIPAFPFEDTESNLRRCRRYYEMTVNKDVNKVIATGGCYQSDVVSLNYQWYPKRAAPSIDQGSGTNYFGFNRGGGAITFNSIKIYSATATNGLLYSDDGVSASTYENGWIYIANANAYIALDSEL